MVNTLFCQTVLIQGSSKLNGCELHWPEDACGQSMLAVFELFYWSLKLLDSKAARLEQALPSYWCTTTTRLQ